MGRDGSEDPFFSPDKAGESRDCKSISFSQEGADDV